MITIIKAAITTPAATEIPMITAVFEVLGTGASVAANSCWVASTA